ncbi:MAG: bL27 family ribosomal protein [Planctomycetes bacterium]|nr:bL27 family ribosomal protein [Planctomycetota bacterium]
MAHKKGQGASRNGRDSNAQRRGIKCYEGELVKPGNIILRQCGTKFIPGTGTRIGRNCDIYSVAIGTVKFQGKKVHILPVGAVGCPTPPKAVAPRTADAPKPAAAPKAAAPAPAAKPAAPAKPPTK